MTNGYDVFGKGVVNSKSEYQSLETMHKLDSILQSMICIEEDAKSRLHQEEKTAYSEWNDVVDMELREVLDNLFISITKARDSYIYALDQLQKCIQRRRDYLCSSEEMPHNNKTEGKHNEKDAV